MVPQVNKSLIYKYCNHTSVVCNVPMLQVLQWCNVLCNLQIIILILKSPFVKTCCSDQKLNPQETCTLKFKNARVVKQPLKTEWCLDENQVIPSQYFNNDDDVQEY